jgi:hypothetical protein
MNTEQQTTHNKQNRYTQDNTDCYLLLQRPPKKVENNFLVSTLRKLLVFLVNYAYYATLSYY